MFNSMFFAQNVNSVIPNDEYAIFKVEVTDDYKTFTMPNPNGYTYNYFVDWGDSNTETVTTSLKTHTYTTNGIYTIKFKGVCPSIDFESVEDYMTVGIDTLGELILTKLSFFYCNLQYINFGIGVDISTITDFNSLFYLCSFLESVDFGTLDTSLITNFDYMFSGCYALTTINDDKLNMDSATSTNGMFSGCSLINTDAPDWWNTHLLITNYTYCFDSNTSRPNYASIPTGWK